MDSSEIHPPLTTKTTAALFGFAGSRTSIVNAVPPQVLAYEIALARGLDPDKPRNLAKSVTVK